MRRVLRAILLILLAMGLFVKAAGAIVPTPISFKDEEHPKSGRQKLIGNVEKLEKHEEENIHLLRELKQDLQGLKNES